MKREETITVDLKVKDYNSIRLKQLDTTKLIFKILDNSTEVDLENKTARIIFSKPGGSIVIQDGEIVENMIEVILKDDCVRRSGKANIEVELKEGTEIVSSFYIEAIIEKTSKEDVTSENTSTYIEEFEKAIAKLQTDSEELLENIKQARSG